MREYIPEQSARIAGCISGQAGLFKAHIRKSLYPHEIMLPQPLRRIF
ncbi:MAG: hypothetical protein H2045_01010 [Rhizobiales bacterium]|nr:hypothetical protein [Hyphomicrobiales bacterium]